MTASIRPPVLLLVLATFFLAGQAHGAERILSGRLHGPHLDIDTSSGLAADPPAGTSSGDDARTKKVGTKELVIGLGLLGGGVIAETIVGIDVAAFNSSYYASYYGSDYGYDYSYSNFAYFPAHVGAVFGAILGGVMIAGGTVLTVGGIIRLARLRKAERDRTTASIQWGLRWGPPGSPHRAPGIAAGP